MELYHIDKANKISVGPLNYLNLNTKFDTEEAKELMDRMFPQGVSPHGMRYLRTPKLVDRKHKTITGVRKSYYIETVIESVRRLEFPEIPSRFVSMFGFESINEALTFAATYRSYDPEHPYQVWKLNVEQASRHDMNWLEVQGSYIHQIYYTQKYWEGIASENPRWEYLMTGKIVAIENFEELQQKAYS